MQELGRTDDKATPAEVIHGVIRRVVKTLGDGMVCAFPQPDHAFQAACDMQAVAPDAAPERLAIKVGFTYGPVVLSGGDVFGDTVNGCARLVALANADQVLTTQQTVDALSAPLREFLSGLRAVHDVTRMLIKVMRDGNAAPDANVAEMQRRHPPVEHPVARTHPVTGRRGLYVNSNFISHFVGLSPTESDMLLRMLFEHVRAPEFQCRLRWEPGTPGRSGRKR